MKVTIKYVMFLDNFYINVINYQNSQNFIISNIVKVFQQKAPQGHALRSFFIGEWIIFFTFPQCRGKLRGLSFRRSLLLRSAGALPV